MIGVTNLSKKSCIACVIRIICLSPTGFALAVVSHVLCSRFLMFAAKLLTHMMVACLGTQVRPNLTSNVVNQLNIEGKHPAYSN